LVVDTPVAKPLPKREVITRRIFILGGFWSAFGLLLVGLLGSPLDFMWIRKITGFGGPVPVSPDRVPAQGADPIVIAEGRFFLLNLEPGITPNGETTPGGLLALWRKCPHLGCTVLAPGLCLSGSQGLVPMSLSRLDLHEGGRNHRGRPCSQTIGCLSHRSPAGPQYRRADGPCV